MTVQAQSRMPEKQRWIRTVYLGFAWFFLISVAIQVFLAGRAIFESPIHWVAHSNFIHVFELIPIVLLILAMAGRAPKGQGLRALPIWLLGLIVLQYLTANVRSIPMVPAIHPVNALVISWLSIVVIKKATTWNTHTVSENTVSS